MFNKSLVSLVVIFVPDTALIESQHLPIVRKQIKQR